VTTVLTAYGAFEINPIMACYFNVGPYTFVIVKYLLTSIGLIILIMFRNIFIKFFSIPHPLAVGFPIVPSP